MTTMKTLKTMSFLALACMLIQTTVTLAGSSSIQVLSATVKDKPIAGAMVIFQKDGQNSVASKTDATGRAKVATQYDTNDKNVILIIKANGYAPLIVKCPCSGMTYALSETMTQLDGMRFVLSWGNHPEDLDAHLIISGDSVNDHIYYGNPYTDDAHLDVDSKKGWGAPETITINNRRNERRYVYAVHAFADQPHEDDAPSNVEPGARVQVYVGRSLVKTYFFGPPKVNDLLCLFLVNERGEIFDLRQPQLNVTGENEINVALREISKQKVGKDRASDNISVLNDIALLNGPDDYLPKKEKKVLAVNNNRLGEKAYHRGDYDTAIGMFRVAVDHDPNYAQAYSNMGLAYQKAQNIPEALWANRRAIATSSGRTMHITRANSYYNIGRIYEDRRDMENAAQNYLWAQQENPQQNYVDAINRVRKEQKNR